MCDREHRLDVQSNLLGIVRKWREKSRLASKVMTGSSSNHLRERWLLSGATTTTTVHGTLHESIHEACDVAKQDSAYDDEEHRTTTSDSGQRRADQQNLPSQPPQ